MTCLVIPRIPVVWEELLSRTREESTLKGLFVAFLTIACLLAAIGVVTDSQITIVGAMVVGPEFGPLAALAVALVRRDRRLRRRSILALAVGFPIAMGVTLAATFVVKFFGWMDVVSLESLHEVDFVYKVGPISFVVALLAGAAGMLATRLVEVRCLGRGVHLCHHGSCRRFRGGCGGKRRMADRRGCRLCNWLSTCSGSSLPACLFSGSEPGPTRNSKQR